VTKIIEFIKNEFNSYSKKTRIAIYIMLAIVLGFALSAFQILFFGLGYTDMNNRMPWAAWIIGDLSLIVLGGGAFFTAFLLYIFRRDEFKPIITSATLIGLLCYAFTFLFLLLDIGQPIRAWFGYIYPNWGPSLMPLSMMTEVVFCITLYFMVLVVEFIPTILEHKVLIKNTIIKAIAHYMHKLMWIMAAVGTFLSFFHQGSLGGLYGVMYAKPVWYRPHLFYLFVVSAMAAGPALTVLVTWFAGKVMKKEVVPIKTLSSLARVSGFMFIIYFAFRIFDIYMMATKYVPAFDRNFWDFWGGYYGLWALIAELVLVFIPILLFIIKKFREQEKTLVIGVSAAVIGMIMNRFNETVRGLSVPNFPWIDYIGYMPTIQEWFIAIGIPVTMALIYMFCAKYLPIFPHLRLEEHEEAGA
jgi:Ni/Fe-hydrogenase subunit HybB-like protein